MFSQSPKVLGCDLQWVYVELLMPDTGQPLSSSPKERPAALTAKGKPAPMNFNFLV